MALNPTTASQLVIADLAPTRKRMSIAFTLETPPSTTPPAEFNINGFPVFGTQIVLNPQSVATVAAWDGSRSLQGGIYFGSSDVGINRGLFVISVQGTQQTFFFGADYPNAQGRMEYLDFCVPIYANSNNPILFTFGRSSDASTPQIFMQGNLNNFELPPYFHQTFQDFP
jgi:hypothetical protein